MKKILSSKKLEKQFIAEESSSKEQEKTMLNQNKVKLKKIIHNLKILGT